MKVKTTFCERLKCRHIFKHDSGVVCCELAVWAMKAFVSHTVLKKLKNPKHEMDQKKLMGLGNTVPKGCPFVLEYLMERVKP
jgi:hypothetical protein